MANIKHNQLTAAKVKALTEPGTYTDGEGLTLRVADTGGKTWVQRITIAGKRRNIGLAEARRKAEENAREVRDGVNPVERKRGVKATAAALAALPSFAEAATLAIELRRPTWSSDRHARQWTESLQLHAFPVIGRKRIDHITTADTLRVLSAYPIT